MGDIIQRLGRFVLMASDHVVEVVTWQWREGGGDVWRRGDELS